MTSTRLRVCALVLVAGFIAMFASHHRRALAQAPGDLFFVHGRNVNTVGLTPQGPNPQLVGNPRHKQRNEASLDVSPSNPLVVLGANNDYRGIERFGDSWIGLFMSRNGGLTFTSQLLEGFPTAPSGVGAADPVVRTMPGLGLVSYITISRSDGRGTLALARLVERNKENGEPYQYFDKRIIGTGTPGRFNDKPAMIAVLDGAGGTIDVGGRRVPRGIIHFAYALFPGNENNSASQIYHLYSLDYGLTWSNDRKLSESLSTNQGVDLAVNGNVVLALWRQIQDTNQSDAIVYARSTDGGQTWGKAEPVWTAPAAGRFFDQDTTPVQFRTRSMPSIVHDGNAFHAFWSARGFAAHPDDARIVVSSSRDGRQWSAPSVLDSHPGRGHQIKPQAAVAGGRIQVNWIDTRNNEPGSFDRNIADFRIDLSGNRVPLNAPAGPSDPPTVLYRQMADVFGAQSHAASANGQPALAFSAPLQVSRYRFALVDGVRRQIDFSFPNGRLFQNGGVPFHGDYHALSGQRHRPSETTPGAWIRNTAPSTSHAVFYSAFTDNRDVQGWVSAGPPSTAFTAGASLQGEPGSEQPVACVASPDTTLDKTVWSPTDSPRSRFQNIYFAPTFPGLIVASPSGSKPTGTLERAYVVFAQNLTAQDRTYRFSITNQPPDAVPPGIGRASFRQNDPLVPSAACADGAACRTIDVAISRASSVTRTVYVQSSEPRPRIVVRVQEIGGAGQTGSVILNADPDIAEIETPDGDGLPNILNVELYEPDILQRQSTVFFAGLTNPDVTPVEGIMNPRIEYPRIEYPRIEYSSIPTPRIEYPRIEFDPLGNPRIEYPRIEYPRIEYTSVENPRIEYSPIASDQPIGVTDITWPVTTNGANTTTAMAAKMFVNGSVTGITGAQLLVSIPHFTTATRSCGGNPVTIVENQVVVNTVVDPTSLARSAGGPDTVNPPATQPTFFVQPNQVAYVTLRLIGRADALLARRAGIIVRSQPDASDGDETDEDQDEGFVDVTPPTINLGGLAGGLSVEGSRPGGADVGFVVTSTDDGGESTVGCVRTGPGQPTPSPVPTNGTAVFYSLGSWQVSCTAVDTSGNKATVGFPVVVADTAPPSLDVSPLQITLAFTTGGAIATYNTSAVVAADLVDVSPTVSCAPPSGSFFPLGPAQLTCTARDDSGNTATAVRAFIITDTVPPLLTVPAPIVVEATSGAGAAVAYAATATDLVDSSPTVVCTPTSGSTFPLGSTTVSCIAADDSGNQTTRTFTITVRDTTPPGSIVATVVPASLWPPNGSIRNVTVSGTAMDAGTGVAIIEWRVTDEYKQHQPSGLISVAGNGPFSFQVPLVQDRRGNDKDGRHYTIQLSAVDGAGNRRAIAQPLVVTVHDQSGD